LRNAMAGVVVSTGVGIANVLLWSLNKDDPCLSQAFLQGVRRSWPMVAFCGAVPMSIRFALFLASVNITCVCVVTLAVEILDSSFFPSLRMYRQITLTVGALLFMGPCLMLGAMSEVPYTPLNALHSAPVLLFLLVLCLWSFMPSVSLVPGQIYSTSAH
jgi:hypothetical protein